MDQRGSTMGGGTWPRRARTLQDRSAAGVEREHHHSVRAGYRYKTSSGVSSTRPPMMAWVTSARSKGSRWSWGSLAVCKAASESKGRGLRWYCSCSFATIRSGDRLSSGAGSADLATLQDLPRRLAAGRATKSQARGTYSVAARTRCGQGISAHSAFISALRRRNSSSFAITGLGRTPSSAPGRVTSHPMTRFTRDST